jgi:hypothetical protein
MKIVIENIPFKFDVGCRLLKLKHEDCPFEQLSDMWNDIEPLTFREIGELENLEQRRVGMLCMGLERLAEQVNPKLLDRQTIEKVSNFIDSNGKLVKEKYQDTYELYEVKGEVFGKGQWGRTMNDCHFVKFKDTSTDRMYMIWVDLSSVARTNFAEKGYFYFSEEMKYKINAIQCIAWTIQTNVSMGNIKEILRQGDCVFVKPKDSNQPMLNEVRHLTEKEYRKLLVAES